MRWTAIAVVLSVAAAAALNLLRLWFGVDFTDEALYTAVPWRFVRGEAPVIDEYNMSQLAAYWCVPVLKAWSAMRGSEGIVLLMRVLHLLLRAGAAVVVAWSLAPILERRLAVVASLFTFAVVPFGIPSVSYNTVAALGFTAGCFAGMAHERGWRGAALAGALHALAAIAYPPLALAVAVFLVARLLILGRVFLVPYIAAAAVACIPYAIVFARAGLDAVRHMAAFAGSATKPEPFLDRLAGVSQLIATAPWWPLLLAPLALLAFAVRRRPRAAAWLIVSIPLVAALNRFVMLYASLGFTSWLALTGCVVTLVLWREDADARRLLACAMLPGLAAGFLTAFFSSNRATNFGVGALVAAQAAVALLALLALRRFRAAPLVAYAAVTLCWLIPTAQQYLPFTVYRDDDLPRLTASVARGPYAGLRTTPAKRAWLEQLQRDLVAVDHPARRVFFYYDFPAGYLLTTMRPAAPSVWTLAGDDARKADGLPASFKTPPDVVVQLARVPYFAGVDDRNTFPGEALDRAFASYRVAVARGDYRILVRPGL